MTELIVFLLGCYAGWKFREYVARKILENIGITPEKEESKEKQDEYIYVLIEKYDNVFYIYEEKTNKFLTQGTSKEIVIKNLSKQYPDKGFRIYKDNAKEVGFE